MSAEGRCLPKGCPCVLQRKFDCMPDNFRVGDKVSNRWNFVDQEKKLAKELIKDSNSVSLSVLTLVSA